MSPSNHDPQGSGQSLQGRVERKAWFLQTLGTSGSVSGCFLSIKLEKHEGTGVWEESTVTFPHRSGQDPVGHPPGHHGQVLPVRNKTGVLFILILSCFKSGDLVAWRWGCLFPLSRIL